MGTRRNSELPRFGGLGLLQQAFVGADRGGQRRLSGAVAMLQVYDGALAIEEVQCIYDSGQQLVHSGRMGQQVPSICRNAVRTGCASHAATNEAQPDDASGDCLLVDDNSCLFQSVSTLGERGVVVISETWQTVHLHGVHTRPVILCGALSRSSTVEAVVRLGAVIQDSSGGTWSFQV